MSKLNGDKSRHNRQRRKKIARRATTRALQATWDAKGATPPPPVGPSGA